MKSKSRVSFQSLKSTLSPKSGYAKLPFSLFGAQIAGVQMHDSCPFGYTVPGEGGAFHATHLRRRANNDLPLTLQFHQAQIRGECITPLYRQSSAL